MEKTIKITHHTTYILFNGHLITLEEYKIIIKNGY